MTKRTRGNWAERAERERQAKQAEATKTRTEVDKLAMDVIHGLADGADADRTQLQWSWQLEMVERERATAADRVARFASGILEKPDRAGYEFQWGTDVVKAAAIAEVNAKALELLRLRGPRAYAVLREEVMRGARSPQFSTSPMANLVETFRLEALAEIVDNVRRLGW